MSDNEILQTVARLVETWNSGDLKTFASLFTEDADYVSGAGQWLKGREAIAREFSTRETQIGEKGTVIISGTWIKKLRPGVALVHNKWELVSTGQGQALRAGIFTQVLIHEASQWRIASLHNTDIADET